MSFLFHHFRSVSLGPFPSFEHPSEAIYVYHNYTSIHHYLKRLLFFIHGSQSTYIISEILTLESENFEGWEFFLAALRSSWCIGMRAEKKTPVVGASKKPPAPDAQYMVNKLDGSRLLGVFFWPPEFRFVISHINVVCFHSLYFDREKITKPKKSNSLKQNDYVQYIQKK